MRVSLLIMIGFSMGLMADFSRDDTAQIVTDNTTGLQWQDDSEAKTIQKEWIQAIGYCESLVLGGYADWRLPNFNELYYIADRNKGYPAMSSTFLNIPALPAPSSYWSSTTVADHESNAWSVSFDRGRSDWDLKLGTSYVRCVRAGQ